MGAAKVEMGRKQVSQWIVWRVLGRCTGVLWWKGGSIEDVQQELVVVHVKGNGRGDGRVRDRSTALRTSAAAAGVGEARRIRPASGSVAVELRCSLKRRRGAQRQGTR